VAKIVECWFDNNLIDTHYLSNSNSGQNSFTVPAQYRTHGYHKVEIKLYQNDGTVTEPIKGYAIEPLQYEIGIMEKGNSDAPVIIWLGNYKSVYYNYDSI
jgi:hypothetical protein